MKTVRNTNLNNNYKESTNYLKQLEIKNKISSEDNKALINLFSTTYANIKFQHILYNFSQSTTNKFTKSIFKIFS